MTVARMLAAFALILALGACRFPADPEGTTDAVEGAVLRVGALHDLGPADQRAATAVADALAAELQVTRADPHQLFAMLDRGDVHLIAGAIPADTPFAEEVALTRPMGKVERDGESFDQVMAVRQGENAFLIRVNRAIAPFAP